MIYYLLSYYRRLTIKLNLYFLALSFLILFIFLNFVEAWAVASFLFMLNFILSKVIREMDNRKASAVICRLCGNENTVLLFPERRKKGTGDVGSFACSSFDHGHYSDIYYCSECKNGFLKDLGTDKFKSFFSQASELYEGVEDKDYIANIEARYLTNQKNVENYIDYFRDKEVLEIGSYYGAFYHEVKKVCSSYQGVEPSRHACEYLGSKLRPVDQVYNGTIEKYLEKIGTEKKYDTIVLFDVIEHVPDPIELLKNINSLLKEDGIVLFSTINIESAFSVVLGPFWPWFMDMHYYYFSDRGYVDMLHRSGFIRKGHKHYPYYVYFSYFVLKILSITLGVKKLPRAVDNFLRFPIKVCFGDTVLIEGQKVKQWN